MLQKKTNETPETRSGLQTFGNLHRLGYLHMWQTVGNNVLNPLSIFK